MTIPEGLATGVKVHVPGTFDRVPEFDPRTGDHLWIMTGAWRIDPAKMAEQTWHLDTENMLALSGPGCFWCEQEFTPRLATRRCKGRP